MGGPGAARDMTERDDLATAAVAAGDILFEHRGALGLVTLNRPRAMNALTHGMALALEVHLDAWAADAAVESVAIQGASEKAFCAGGDIRALYEAGRPGGEAGRANFQFYADEYRLNTKIKRYPKPYIALMDGVVMGGGVGVSIHGSHRFATERTVFAMPETGIGLFPDVGATWFLPRMEPDPTAAVPGTMGLFCGLTGARLKGQDAATLLDAQALCAADLPKLIEWLCSGPDPATIDRFAQDQSQILALDNCDDWLAEGQAQLASVSEIAVHFSGNSVGEILASLTSSETEWAARQRRTILTKSPLCTEIAFRQIRTGASLSFEECMRLEYRLARFCMTRPDFYEGVRAVIIDKDNAPKWDPPTLDQVNVDLISMAFTPLGAGELEF